MQAHGLVEKQGSFWSATCAGQPSFTRHEHGLLGTSLGLVARGRPFLLLAEINQVLLLED